LKAVAIVEVVLFEGTVSRSLVLSASRSVLVPVLVVPTVKSVAETATDSYDEHE